MISTIRRALTPNANRTEDRDANSLNTSPVESSILLRHSSPPPFSPFEASEQDISPWAAHVSNGNVSTIPEQHKSIDISADPNLPDREKEATDYSLLGPVTAEDPTPEPHHGPFSLDGASDDHLALPLQDPHLTNRPPPSAESAQFTGFSQPSQEVPPPSANHLGPNPRTSSTPQPSKMLTEASRGNTPRSQISERVMWPSVKASAEPQQSAPTATGNVGTSTSTETQSPKRKRQEDTPEAKTKSVKKQRGQVKKAEDSTATSTQQDASKDRISKDKGRTEGDKISTGNVGQQVMKDETPKKRGRPKKDEGATQKVKPQRAPKKDILSKRSRAGKGAASQATGRKAITKQDKRVKETPKKRGRSSTKAEPAVAAKPTGVPAADAPKKRGRPKKEEGDVQGSEPKGASAADTPKKRGRPTINKDTAEASEPQGSPTTGTSKKRGRPKATEQSKAAKTLPPGKRGRPKKEATTLKGAKPAGIVKKKAGRK